MSTNQNGATSGKSPADNVFLVNACIDHSKYLNNALYLGFYDFEQCFDKLWLKDCIKEICEAGMPIPEAFYILQMNRDVTAIVDTPFGMSEPFHAT